MNIALGCGWAVMAIISPMIALPLQAFVIRQLWRWFVTAEWGIAVPSWGAAMGLSLLVAVLWYRSPTREPDADSGELLLQTIVNFLTCIVVLLWLLFVGYIVQRVVG